MANKPIIQINVDDEQFKSFFELYKQFHANVEELPDEWRDVGAAAIGAE
jgi:hypothetical protein